jgi:hypothetical protein
MVGRARRRAGAGARRCGRCARDRFPEGFVGEARRVATGSRGCAGCATGPPLSELETHQDVQDSPARGAGTWSATMTAPLLTLMVLIIAFGAEVGWLCWC